MATRKKVKKNIKEDHLVTYAVEVSRWAQEHFTQVIIGVVALIIAIAAIVFTANSRQSAGEQSARQVANALALYQAGDFDAALTSFQQIRERYSGRDAAIARFFEGETELRQSSYDAAIVSYDAYLEESSKYPMFRHSALYGKAIALEGKQDYSGAALTMVESMAEISEDDPRYLDAAFQAGEFFAKAGNKEDARKYFDQVKANAEGELLHRARIHAALLEH